MGNPGLKPPEQKGQVSPRSRTVAIWLIPRKIICLLLFGHMLLFFAGCAPTRMFTVRHGVRGRSISGPSLSPDGKSIAFSAKPYGETKDSFVCLLDGTGERKLTQHLGIYSPLRWSPDGQFLYFTSNREGHLQIYRVRNDGTELKNISENSANDELCDLSPDGKDVVFQRRSPGAPPKNADLVIASSDGKNQRVLVKGGWNALWSPDGQWILHGRAGERWIIRPDASEELRIAFDGMHLAWTPDSKAIFYCDFRKPNINLVNVDGTGNKTVLKNVDRSYYYYDYPRPLPSCSWDPSGSRLAIAAGRGLGEIMTGGIVLLGRHGELIADYRPRESHFQFWGACWATDGKTILYSKVPVLPDETKGGIYKMNEDGTGEQQVVPDNTVWSSAPETEEDHRIKIKEMRE